jgi:anti-sigma factor RsiW
LNQVIVIESGTCRRARQTLSAVLDGESSAAEQAETALHLPGCEDCARFAALVTELKRRLRAPYPVRGGKH